MLIRPDVIWKNLSRPLYHVHFTVIHTNSRHKARHRGFASLTDSKSQSRIVVTSAAAHGRIVKTVKKGTTYMVGTVKRQNTSSSERSWQKIAETRQSLFRKSAWSGYAHKMCAVDSNMKRIYSNEMSDRATHFTVFMIMNCPVEQQILAAYGGGSGRVLYLIKSIYERSGISLGICPANERRRYNVTTTPIGWAHTRADLWVY